MKIVAFAMTLMALAVSLGEVVTGPEPMRDPPADPLLSAGEVATACGTLVGQATACGLQVRALEDACLTEMRRLIDRERADRGSTMRIYDGAIAFGTDQQRGGRSGRRCAAVREAAKALVPPEA